MFFYTTLLLFKSLLFLNASEWLYYKYYPWVYDNKSKDWLYLRGSDDGKIYAYRASSKAWEEFGKGEPTWEEQYEEWIKNPDPYGGLDVLQKIKNLRLGITSLSNRTLDLSNQNISDVTPVTNGIVDLVKAGQITSLILNNNNISDLTAFLDFPDGNFFGGSESGLMSLEIEFNKINSTTDINPVLMKAYYIYLQGNDLSDEQKKEIEDTRGQLVFVENRLY